MTKILLPPAAQTHCFGERDLDEDPDGHAKYLPSLTTRFSPRLAILYWGSFSYEAK